MDRLDRLPQDAQREVITKSLQAEVGRSELLISPTHSMHSAPCRRSELSIRGSAAKLAERVGKQLANSISSVEFELQGSVPLNVHIHGVSDVDLLTLDASFFIYDPTGVAGRGGS